MKTNAFFFFCNFSLDSFFQYYISPYLGRSTEVKTAPKIKTRRILTAVHDRGGEIIFGKSEISYETNFR